MKGRYCSSRDLSLASKDDLSKSKKTLLFKFVSILSPSKYSSPTISPNGNIIIYATKKDENGYLAGLTLNGKSRFALPLKNGSVREPAWSPLLK